MNTEALTNKTAKYFGIEIETYKKDGEIVDFIIGQPIAKKEAEEIKDVEPKRIIRIKGRNDE